MNDYLKAVVAALAYIAVRPYTSILPVAGLLEWCVWGGVGVCVGVCGCGCVSVSLWVWVGVGVTWVWVYIREEF